MKKVLLFNISGEKLARINSICAQLGIRPVKVDRADFGMPLGELTGRIGRFGEREDDAVFAEELLVMDGLDEATFTRFLAALRHSGAAVALKAVVTEHNLTWSPRKLQAELAEEHAKVMAQRNSQKPSGSE